MVVNSVLDRRQPRSSSPPTTPPTTWRTSTASGSSPAHPTPNSESYSPISPRSQRTTRWSSAAGGSASPRPDWPPSPDRDQIPSTTALQTSSLLSCGQTEAPAALDSELPSPLLRYKYRQQVCLHPTTQC